MSFKAEPCCVQPLRSTEEQWDLVEFKGALRIQKCKDSQHETLINTKAKTLCNISNYANYQHQNTNINHRLLTCNCVVFA